MQGRLGEFEARGARVAAVGQGTGAEAAAAARRHGITFPVLGDPGHQSYRTLGLGRTGWWGLTLAPFADTVVLVVAAESADASAGAALRDGLERSGARCAGLVFNRAQVEPPAFLRRVMG